MPVRNSISPIQNQLVQNLCAAFCAIPASDATEPIHPGKRFSEFYWWVARAALLLFVVGIAARNASANVIYVTTLKDKVSSTGGCSLKEAIFSANLATNTAISSYGDAFSPAPQSVTTQCVPGSVGSNIIVLPSAGLLQLSTVQDDPNNDMGPAATTLITSNITIEGYGATLQFVPGDPVCNQFLNIACTPARLRAFAIGSTGTLIVKNTYFKGFLAHGGYGGFDGGGGGMGAGGAIYVQGGNLTVVSSTFDGNGAVGGDGNNDISGDPGGGGGGMGGPGGPGSCADQGGEGGGGGGSRGYGIGSCTGDGGGTIFDADNDVPGYACGGESGHDDHTAGHDAACAGGGGGGGWNTTLSSGDGGKGGYGGGGGGGADGGGNGGNGGFGGGGGSGWTGFFGGTNGGTGGFGGGGGAAQDGHVGGGDPGAGGTYGGRGSKFYGGGGAGLGGAIFNDSGTVVVMNSTFTNNYVTRGVGGGAGTNDPADNGADAGGAIFSLNGHLTIVDSTISGNASTGADGGVTVYQFGSPAPATSITLNDTIISNNGASECSVNGTSVTANGAGNLIDANSTTHPCPGVTTTSDPGLSPLGSNGGYTPTMAISQSGAAFDAADAATSLSTDQRGVQRPQHTKFDIGAFELCPPASQFVGPLGCQTLIQNPPPDTAKLTILSSPLTGGILNPSTTGSPYSETLDSVVLVSAAPNPGFSFVNWTGAVTDPTSASTSVIMNQDQTVTANFAGPSAIFVTNDNTTQGNWIQLYGADGHDIANGPQFPANGVLKSGGVSYGSYAIQNQTNFTWPISVGDPNAALVTDAQGDRIASAWYSTTTFSIDVNITDTQVHQMSLYLLDFDNHGRSETIKVSDSVGHLLDTRLVPDSSGDSTNTFTSASNFVHGTYLIYNVSGHVIVTITRGAGPNGVVSGIFFGGPSAPVAQATASYVGADTSTTGSWMGVYGADGYSVAGGGQSLPVYDPTLSIQPQVVYVWDANPTPANIPAGQSVGNAPETGTDGPSSRIAATWYNPGSFKLDVNINDGQPHKVALYVLDWDNLGRSETVTISDATSGAQLDSPRSVSNFKNGTYLVWTITGHVTITVASNGAPNAVVAGIFFGGGGNVATPGTATWLSSDTTTQGSWIGKYGSNGYSLANAGQSFLVPATLTVQNALTYTWESNPTPPDAKDLQTDAQGHQIAAAWYNTNTFSFDLNLADGVSHQIALYVMDWDNKGRAETIQITDVNGNVLDTRVVPDATGDSVHTNTSASNFANGAYILWTMKGHVTIKVTAKAAPNAVVSGLFID